MNKNLTELRQKIDYLNNRSNEFEEKQEFNFDYAATRLDHLEEKVDRLINGLEEKIEEVDIFKWFRF